ncbi:MAG: shikimate dehydrogenase [Euryarchaeota archaeon]|nr:shikimate dehydrogenase [Euryarchaeota archaeon]MBV1729668.1 shikimate dehydrogenase [Methanobacterium sp.]MBU4548176.1 shikimate dehydrogenase [Euryarchaeota archaeon]MBU4607809.1 shikimate dehydrogenase [Euryarchaeota archaeon]MBV1754248.1 shikimate dehydrogenase [Methanobacterium sp.]
MITGKTKIIGLFGDPVGHSFSPAMHNAAFRYKGLDYVYVPFNVKAEFLKEATQGASALNLRGYNVTIPHKTRIIDYLLEVDPTAALIGAVNTVKIQDGLSKGYNTDGIGAIRAIEEITSISNKKVIILGAGGASRAVSFQLLSSYEVELLILNRTPEKAFELKCDLENNLKTTLSAGGFELLDKEIDSADILINTTPRGMHPHEDDEPILKAQGIPHNMVVNDLVYNPLETGLIKEATKAGATTISGLKMLLYQGVEAFKIWTGQEPPADIMEKALYDFL